jgi:hypothetical protein
MGYMHAHYGILTIEGCDNQAVFKAKWKELRKIIEGWEDWSNYKPNVHPMART